MNSSSSQRVIHSAGLPPGLVDSPYARPLTTGTVPDKNNIIWKDFIYGVKKRKDLIKRLRDAALESSTPIALLKKTLLDLRNTTLTLVEDALEIEYRARISGTKSKKSMRSKLPPITSYRAMEEKENIYALADIIGDVDDLFSIPNVRVMLPMSFPAKRNPFMLGKDIDELANLIPPHPEAGNADEELKVLELLRYKRASRALIRAEAQILNRLPMDLYDVENWIAKTTDDPNMERLLRCVCALLDNDRSDLAQEADLTCLLSPIFNVEAHELLRRLNIFQGAQPMRIDVQVAVRHMLRESNFEYLEDPVSTFFMEWMELVLQTSKNLDPTNNGQDLSRKSLPPSRYGIQSLNSISEFPPSQALSSPKYQQPPKSSQGQRPPASSQGQRPQYPPGSGQGQRPSSQPRSPNSSFQFPGSPSQKDRPAIEQDLTSEVGPDDYVRTHEKIYEPEPERKKLMSRSLETFMQSDDGKVDQGVGSDYVEPPRKAQRVQATTTATATTTTSPLKPRKIHGEGFDPNAKGQDDMLLGPPKASMKKKIRNEVEKAMRELGFFRENDDVEGGRGTLDQLNSVRYELNKMQQELLRRQVLDPRHYAVNSVDAVTHANRGLTVADINAFDPMDKRGKAKKSADSEQSLVPINLGEKVLPITLKSGDLKLYLNILLNTESKSLLCSVNVFKQAALQHGFIKEHKALNALPQEDSMIELTYFEVSKLIFSRLTDYSFQDLLEAKADMRPRMLMNIFQQLEKLGRAEPIPRGKLLAVANRVLFNNKFSEDNVLVDLTISRNDECTGLVLHCVPIAGLFQSHGQAIGPIIIHLYDTELEVLLLSQYGLYSQAMNRWKSLEVLAQWLAGRVRVRKVAAASLVTEAAKTLTAENLNGTLQKTLIPDDQESVTSQITFTGRKNEGDDYSAGELEVKLNGLELTKTATHAHSTTLLMLQVTVDRHIDISNSFLEHWKSRNTPKIVGIEVALHAHQDLEVMVFDISITLPNKRAYKKMLAELEKSTSSGNKDLMDMDNYSDDDDDYGFEESQPTKIDLSYRLTRAELLTFGSIAPTENKKVSMSKNTHNNDNKESHPEDMLWNVLSRMKVSFKGSKTNPYSTAASASDAENWVVEYDRLIHRDVKTVNQHILMISVLAVGGELLLKPEPVDTTSKKKVLSKQVSEQELKELVQGEGWPMQLVEYRDRKEAARGVLNKLKVIPCENSDDYQLQLYTHVESRMLIIAKAGSPQEPEEEIGAVEINSHHTLSDLRILIKHEFDIDELPTQFRFLYKGLVCSLRQETFRRAWECLPCCYISPKIVVTSDMGMETDDIAQKRINKLGAGEKTEQVSNIPRLLKGQRRMPGKYIPQPVPTLCIVQEGVSLIYTLHPVTDLFVPGDVIRVGNVAGRDYIIQSIGVASEDGANYQVIEIQPEYDIAAEPDFNMPTMKNFPYPSGPTCGMYLYDYREYIRLLKTAGEMGFKYNLPLDLQQSVGDSTPVIPPPPKIKQDDDERSVGSASALTEPSALKKLPDLPLSKLKKKEKSKKGGMAYGSRVFVDCWLWKCIPSKEETRRKWRLMYDNGEIMYNYEFKTSEECLVHFRVRAWYGYMEVLCTDSRCPNMTYYYQRVHEMRSIPIDFYTKLIFEKITDWAPAYKKGIERVKFIKLMKDVVAFPDLKRPARIAQLDMHFAKLVKMSEYGIVQKYLNYAGFVYLLKVIAVIRFPPRKKKAEEGGEDDDNESVASMNSLQASVNGNNADNNDKKGKSSKSKGGNKAAELPVKPSPLLKGGKSGKEVEEETPSSTLSNVDPEHLTFAFQKFILDYIMLYPGWYDVPWKEAKLMAMRKEALRYCAATRIAALARGRIWYLSYRRFLKQHIILQAHIRRKLSNKKVAIIVQMLYEDWYFRIRYHKALVIQKWIRRFIKQCWYHRVMEQKKRQEVILCRARRQKLKKYHEKTRKPVMYREIKRINGVCIFLSVTRIDSRGYSRDYGVMINCYVPDTQDKFCFQVTDPELREYMALLLEVPAVTAGQLMDKRNMEKLLAVRLIVHKASQKHDSPVILFSKHALGQRGEHSFTRAKRIQKEFFVCKIYETVEDVALQMYHRRSCKVFTMTMMKRDLFQWIKDDMLLQHELAERKKKEMRRMRGTDTANLAVTTSPKKTLENGKATESISSKGKDLMMIDNGGVSEKKSTEVVVRPDKPPLVEDLAAGDGDEVELGANELPILNPRNKQALYYWLLEHIVVDKRRGKFDLVFANHYEKSHKKEMLIKIQSMWRRGLVRPIIIRMLDAFMLRVRGSSNPEEDVCYYLNVKTGASSWQKPFLLGKYDLPTKPSRRWVPVTYEHRGMWYVHYVNPWTGKFTHYTIDQAIRKLQALVRNYLLKPLRMNREHYFKAAKLFMQAQKVYETTPEPRKLACVINYALVLHSIEVNELQAKEVYREAVNLSESNPLVTRAYAFFLLGTCENPITLNRDRAVVLLLDAKRKDPEHVKFQTAYALFQFAALRSPRDYRVLINLALIQSMLFELNYNAEKLFRRALAIAPFEERVIELWKFIKDKFPDRQIVYNPLSRVHKINTNNKNAKLRMVHGRPAQENNNWAGWVYIPEDSFNVSKTIPKGYPYWYNPADGTESLDPPDFAEQWLIRRNRSYIQEEEHGLEHFYDPLTSEYFQYHSLTDTYS